MHQRVRPMHWRVWLMQRVCLDGGSQHTAQGRFYLDGVVTLVGNERTGGA